MVSHGEPRSSRLFSSKKKRDPYDSLVAADRKTRARIGRAAAISEGVDVVGFVEEQIRATTEAVRQMAGVEIVAVLSTEPVAGGVCHECGGENQKHSWQCSFWETADGKTRSPF